MKRVYKKGYDKVYKAERSRCYAHKFARLCVHRWLFIIKADNADKEDPADKAAAKNPKRKRVLYKRADEPYMLVSIDAVGEADKIAKVAKSYADVDLNEVTLREAKHRVYSAGYHSERTRKLNQGFQLEDAKKYARVFASECLDRWLETIKSEVLN